MEKERERWEKGRGVWDLVTLPADGGESVDHALNSVELAYEIGSIVGSPGGRTHHLRSSLSRLSRPVFPKIYCPRDGPYAYPKTGEN